MGNLLFTSVVMHILGTETVKHLKKLMNSKSRCSSKSKISLLFSITISNWDFIIVSIIFIIKYFLYNYWFLCIIPWKLVHHRKKTAPLYIILSGNQCLTRGKPLLNMDYYVAISLISFITDMQYLSCIIPWYCTSFTSFVLIPYLIWYFILSGMYSILVTT